MRNFYDQPKNKIFDGMFGKQARQIQADPTLDISKCNCCNGCGEIICKGCIQGAVIGPNAGCCPSKDESLIFEHTRPNNVYESACCDFNELTGITRYQCCKTTKVGARNVKYKYHYVGKYYRMDYMATGHPARNGNTARWPANNQPRLCSWCDPQSTNESDDPEACDCLDFAFPDTADDYQESGPCVIDGGCVAAFENCLCMGDDNSPLKNLQRGLQRLSKYRRKQMEREPYYRWLLDIMCYDNGNILKDPWEEVNDLTAQVDDRPNGTLYNHLVGVVHCEHWWELDNCPENPDVKFEEEQFENVNISCFVPRFWIQACSGVPVFDFEFRDAVSKGYISNSDLFGIWEAMSEKKTPEQSIMNRMSAGGYFDTGDWRQQALSEIANLQGRTYTRDAYAGINIPQCSSLNYLGPVRKRFYSENVFPLGHPYHGLNIPSLLNPKKARRNVINRNPGINLGPSLQLPETYLRDPWDGDYPTEPPEDASPEEIEEWNDFIAWKDSQWLYMHARPGGWDYVCFGYFAGDPTVKIPDLPRRSMSDVITCPDPENPDVSAEPFAGCLGAILGIPQRTTIENCGTPLAGCGNYQDTGCGGFVCLGVECYDDSACGDYLEQGGGVSPCAGVMVESTCEGLSIKYSRQAAVSCGINRVANWVTTRQTQAWLYKVNITKGNYTSFCPHVCRNLSIPKPISTRFDRIYKKRPAHRYLCANYYHSPEEYLLPCPGLEIPEAKWCFRGQGCVYYDGEGEQCDEYHQTSNCAQYCSGSEAEPPYWWGTEPYCCSKEAGPAASPSPVPTDPTHPAFRNVNCNQCYAGDIYSGANYCPSSLGCCYNCCDPVPDPSFVTADECYLSDDPNAPENAHLFWIPSVNGINCGFNQPPNECLSGETFPACPD